MKDLYYNIVKRKFTSEAAPFAVYVSTSDTSLNECHNYETLDELLGTHNGMCTWEKEAVNIKKIVKDLNQLGMNRSFQLLCNGEFTVA